MFKATTQITVSLELVKEDPTARKVWRHAKNPAFCNDAISRFKHYTCPVAYKKGKYYYVLTHYGSIVSMKTLQQTTITLEEIQLSGIDILEFLLSFQYHQHKEILCMAELFKLATSHTAKGSAGEKWLNSIAPGTKDKEKQFSILFGISVQASKYYNKIIKPIHQQTLAKFATDSEFTLKNAYEECVQREYSLSPTKGGQVLPDQTQALVYPSTTDQATDEPANSGNTSSTNKAIQNAAPQIEVAAVSSNTAIKGQSNGKQQITASLGTGAIQQPVLHPLTSKIAVKFNSGQTLSLTGIIDFTVDGNAVINTNQLKANGNDWELPDGNAHFFLSIYNA